MKKITALFLVFLILILSGCTGADIPSTESDDLSSEAGGLSTRTQTQKEPLKLPSAADQLKWAKINTYARSAELSGFLKAQEGGYYIADAGQEAFHISKGKKTKVDDSLIEKNIYEEYLSDEQIKYIDSLKRYIEYFSDSLIIWQNLDDESFTVGDYNRNKFKVSYEYNLFQVFVFFDRIWWLTNTGVIGDDLNYAVYSCDFAGLDVKKHSFTTHLSNVFFDSTDGQECMYFIDGNDKMLKKIVSPDAQPVKVMDAPVQEEACDEFTWYALKVGDAIFGVTECATEENTEFEETDLNGPRYSQALSLTEPNNFAQQMSYHTTSSSRVYMYKDGKSKLIFTDEDNGFSDMWVTDDSLFIEFFHGIIGNMYLREFSFDGKLKYEYDLSNDSVGGY